jgi:flagellar hook protein FlgE
MSFLRSLFAGVSGIRNHQLMMDVIGNNISNINTVGFKSGRVTFGDSFAQTLRSATQPSDARGGMNPIQVGVGSSVNGIDTLFSQGTIETTGQATDMAVQGNGFFIVKKDGKTLYTRAGSFQLDGTGRLVNPGNGAILQGKIANPDGSIPAGTALQDLLIPLDMKSGANPTTLAKFAGNLDASADPYNAGPPETGGKASASVSVFDSLGNRHTVTLTFTKNTAANTWDWSASVPGATGLTGNSGQITFNSDGTLANGITNPLTFAPNNGAAAMSITLNIGSSGVFSGLTQTQGTSSVTAREQDGYGAGTLSDISIDASGKVLGTFTNGRVLTLAQVLLAEFNNAGGLVRSGDNLYDVSGSSGNAMVVSDTSTSSIVSNALEQSNVDLADEFTRMILAQRGFQANARVISTSDEFLNEVVNLKR